MSATFTFHTDEKTGNTVAHIRLSSKKTSTFHSDRITLNKASVVTEANDTQREQEDLEEIEWRRIVNASDVQHGLRRLAAEARRQIAVGEIEEGGFAIE